MVLLLLADVCKKFFINERNCKGIKVPRKNGNNLQKNGVNMVGDESGKTLSTSAYFRDPKHGITVVLEQEYPGRFLVHFFILNTKRLTKYSRAFSRKKLKELLLLAIEKGVKVIELMMNNMVAEIKVSCLRKFLEV